MKTKRLTALILSLLLVHGMIPALSALAAAELTAALPPAVPSGAIVHSIEFTNDNVSWQQTPSVVTRTHNSQRGTMTFVNATSTGSYAIANFAPFEASSVSRIIIGYKDSFGDQWPKIYWNNQNSFNTTKAANFNTIKSSQFIEHQWNISSNVNWTGTIGWFRIDIPKTSTVELDYIRFVTADYTSLVSTMATSDVPVVNFEKNYDRNNNIIDFTFSEPVKTSTVKEANITVNGAPVRRITKTYVGATSTAAQPATLTSFRVDLGKLSNSTRYRVEFPGVTTEAGVPISSQYVFTTGTGVLAEAEFQGGVGPINNGYFIPNYGVPPENVTHDPAKGTVTLQTTSGAGGTFIHLYPDAFQVPTNDVKQIVMRIKTSKTGTFRYRLLLNGKNQADGTTVNEIEAPIVVWAGSDFHEYIIDTSALNKTVWANQTLTSFRLDMPADATIELDYFRLVNYSYETNGYLGYWDFRGTNPIGLGNPLRGGGITTYTQESGSIYFIAGGNTDLVMSTSGAMILNPASVGMVEVDAKSNTGMAIVGYFTSQDWYPSSLDAQERFFSSSVSARGVYKDYPTDRFRAKDASCNKLFFQLQKGSSATDINFYSIRLYPKNYVATPLSAPVRTLELVSGFETAGEAPLSGTLPAGAVTVVAGGFCSPDDNPAAFSLYLALYEDDMLKAVECAPDVVLGSGRQLSGQCSVTVDVPAEGGNYSVKAFLWRDGVLCPVTRVLTPADNQLQLLQ